MVNSYYQLDERGNVSYLW